MFFDNGPLQFLRTCCGATPNFGETHVHYLFVPYYYCYDCPYGYFARNAICPLRLSQLSSHLVYKTDLNLSGCKTFVHHSQKPEECLILKEVFFSTVDEARNRLKTLQHYQAVPCVQQIECYNIRKSVHASKKTEGALLTLVTKKGISLSDLILRKFSDFSTYDVVCLVDHLLQNYLQFIDRQMYHNKITLDNVIIHLGQCCEGAKNPETRGYKSYFHMKLSDPAPEANYYHDTDS